MAVEEIITFLESNAPQSDARRRAYELLGTLAVGSRYRKAHAKRQRLIDIATLDRYIPDRTDWAAVDNAKRELVRRRREIAEKVEAAREETLRAISDANRRLEESFKELHEARHAVQPRRWDAFMSFASQDREVARRLFSRLEKNSTRTFMADFCLKPGDDWHDRLPEAQDGSDATVPLISEHTANAHFQISEINRAITLHRTKSHRIFPVYTKRGLPVPFGLEQFHSLFVGEDSVDGIATEIGAGLKGLG